MGFRRDFPGMAALHAVAATVHRVLAALCTDRCASG